MEEKESPKVTGISDITGKVMRIRHAIETDMPFIEENLRKHNFDTHDLEYNQFVVATENGEITGFGRLTKTGELYKIGCVVVIEEKRRRGIGSMIVRHLLEYSPVDIVYVLTDLIDYFKRLGFEVMKEGSKELMDALDEACREMEKKNAVLMVYEKSRL